MLRSTSRQSCRMRVISRPIEFRCWILGHGSPLHHRYAINWAGSNAQLTTGTNIRNHRMGLTARTDDRVDGAGRQAFDTPNASILVDDRNQRWTLDAIGWVEGTSLAVKQVSEGADGRRTTWRALVDLCQATGDRLGIWATSLVAATRALRLWQKRVNIVGECHLAPS